MDADPNTYEDFEEFDDLILDAPFEEQGRFCRTGFVFFLSLPKSP